MTKRILIVEHEADLALEMAAVLHADGFATSIVHSAADAFRELEERHPDLLFVRAELPEQNGFTLCARVRRDPRLQAVPVLLASSDSAPEALEQHAAHPRFAAQAYLTVPFAMDELRAAIRALIPEGPEEVLEVVELGVDAEAAAVDGASDEDPVVDLESVLGEDHGGGAGPSIPDAPAILSPGAAPLPPKLPRRERRGAITEDDKAFIDRVFGGIADRKGELLTEARGGVRRSNVRRDLINTPEGKLQLLRDELRSRDAHIARLSEIWAIRDHELSQGDDRLHEKEVEVQGLKMQVDDLMARMAEAKGLFLRKEREHGENVDHLLQQQFIQEKELIEVVAGKEKDINALRREVSLRDDELEAGAADREGLRQELAARLEEGDGIAAAGLRRERELLLALAGKEVVVALQDRDRLLAEEDRRRAAEELAQRLALAATRLRREEGSASRIIATKEWELREQGQRLADALSVVSDRDREIAGDRQRHQEEAAALDERITSLELALEESDSVATALRVQRDGIFQAFGARLVEKDHRIVALEHELDTLRSLAARREEALTEELAAKVEALGNVEGELESLRVERQEIEAELRLELASSAERHEAMLAAAAAAEIALQSELATSRELHDTALAAAAEREENLEAEISGARAQHAAALAEKEAWAAAELEIAAERHAAASAELHARSAAELEDLRIRAASELEALRTRSAAEFDELQERSTAEIEGLQARSAAELEELQTQTATELDALRVASSVELDGVRAQATAELDSQRSRAAAELDELQTRAAAEKEAQAATIAALGAELAEWQERHERLSTSTAAKEALLTATIASGEERHEQLVAEWGKKEAAFVEEAREGAEVMRVLDAELIAARGELESTAAGLDETSRELRGTRLELEETTARLDEAVDALETTRGELDESRAQLSLRGEELAATREERDTRGSELDAARSELTELRTEHAGLAEELAIVRASVGEREAQITAELAEIYGRSSNLEVELAAVRGELATKEERWLEDRASRTDAIAELERRLEAEASEKKRIEGEGQRALVAKTDALRVTERKLQQAEAARVELEARLGHELEGLRASSGEQGRELEGYRSAVAGLTERLEEAEGQRASLERESKAAVSASQAQLEALIAEVAGEREANRRREAELRRLSQQAEAQLAAEKSQSQRAVEEHDRTIQELTEQTRIRAKRAQEIEKALETATSQRSRLEREQQKTVEEVDAKLNDLTTRLTNAQREKKEVELRISRELDEVAARHRAELGRREQQRGLEVGRLQTALQDKTKALKVAELELARIKARAARVEGAAKNVAVQAGGVSTSRRPGTRGDPVAAASPKDAKEGRSEADEIELDFEKLEL